MRVSIQCDVLIGLVLLDYYKGGKMRIILTSDMLLLKIVKMFVEVGDQCLNIINKFRTNSLSIQMTGVVQEGEHCILKGQIDTYSMC